LFHEKDEIFFFCAEWLHKRLFPLQRVKERSLSEHAKWMFNLKEKIMNTTIEFGFEVINMESGQAIYTGSKAVDLSEKDIKQVASIMEQHGGYAVEICDLEDLHDKVWNYCIGYYQDLCASTNKAFDWDSMSLEVQENMPKELVAAAEPYIVNKSVDINYYYLLNGKEEKMTVKASIPAEVFDKMVEMVKSGKTGKTDFELLRETDGVAYHNILYCSLEDACKEMKGNAKEQEPYLKEFPYQVYDNLDY
jgi:hypothetical protein